jgi:putative ABC transport system substrate-binding protein
MQRRQFITLVSGAVAWPLAADAQQSNRIRVIGALMGYAENDPAGQSLISAFRDALAKLGWAESRNLRIETRWGAGNLDRIKTFAKELVGLRPDAILAQATAVTATLANETRTIPIVFAIVADPLASGFAASLAHPGGNITGFTADNSALGGKWIELLKELAPRTERVALLFNPTTSAPHRLYMPSIQTAVLSLGVQATAAPVQTKDEIEAVIAAQARDAGGGLIVLPDTFNAENRELIIALVGRYNLPTMYYAANYARSGGLISYGPDFVEQFRQAAGYIDRILKGANPAELPVQAPTKFSLVVNLKAAKVLGLTVSPSLLTMANEVVE